MIRKRETDRDETTRVQTHETDTEGTRALACLSAPGMHRIANRDLFTNAVEDLGGGGALRRRAKK